MKKLIAVLILILASACTSLHTPGAGLSLTGNGFDLHQFNAALVAKGLAEAELAAPMAEKGRDDRGGQHWSDIAAWLRLYPVYTAPADCSFCQLEQLRLVRLWLSSPEQANADDAFRALFTDKGSILGWLTRGLH